MYEGEEELIAFLQVPLRCRQTLKTTKNSQYRRFCNVGGLTRHLFYSNRSGLFHYWAEDTTIEYWTSRTLLRSPMDANCIGYFRKEHLREDISDSFDSLPPKWCLGGEKEK